jgi:hypothetical protein
MTFTVTLSTTSFEDVTLSFNTSNGTATLADNDYQSATGTVTILAGTTTATVDVTIVGDLKYELDETFTLAATVTAGTATDPADATGTIQNDDAAPTVTIADVSQAEGNAGTSTMTFTVTLSTTSFEDITLSFNTSNGTATLADNDYQSATGTVTILAGTTTATVDVTIVGDLKYELDETFTLAATVTAGTATDPADATGTIQNDDAAPTVTIADVSQAEGNAGTSTMTFTVTLSTTSFEDITLSFNTSNGTATLADNDYQSATGTVTILAGTTTATIDVTIVGDLKYELDETFTLAATVTAGTATDPADATGTIQNDDAAPTVTIANVSQAEGNAGTSTMTFTVTLSTTSFEDVTLSFNTSNGTATLADNDYQLATGTVTILAGTTTATIDVTIVGDLKYELDETFTLAATVTAGTATDPADATGTIQNDDAAPTVTIANVSQAEGNAGTSTMTFTVTLSTTSFEDVTLSFNTSNGTATLADNDYQSATGTVTILAGTTTATVDVTIVGDLKYELDETFTLAATVTAGTATDPADATGTIQNDDAAPTVTIADVSQAEGNAGTSTMTFTVTLSTTSFEDITLSFNTSNGTATLADNDYQSATGTVTILAGTTTATVDVTIVGDLKYELDETFTLAATVTAGTATDPADATGTIQNDDAAPTVTIADVSQAEGNAGTSTMTFTVTLSTTSFEDITLSFNTSNGTATLADNDYQSATGTVTILAGTTTATVDVTIVGDLKYELDETFTLAATVTAGTATDPADATGTIQNDDAAPTVTIADVSQAEGNAGTSTMTFTVTLSTTSFEDITLSFNTSNGTATLADNDYQSATGTVTILAGTTTATVDVTIVGDLKYELDETFTLAATVTAGTATDPADATGTIQNDDAAPTVTIADVSQAEGNAGTSTMTFTVTLSTTSFEDVTLSFNTSNGTATLADNDYQSATGTVTILAGTTTATIDVTIVGDLKYELDETFTLAATVTAGTATDPTDATGTIQNDDAAPTVTIADVSQAEGNAGTSTMTFTVTLSTTSFEDVTLSFNTSNGTATLADNDYQSATGTVTILAGTTTATIDVTIVGDLKYELDETFTLAATVTAGTATDPADATGTILNDDAAPTVTIADVSQAEGNAGTSTMTFTVTLSTTSFEDVTLSFNTSNGTATLADNDYQSATGTVTILAGTTTATIDVTIVGDLKYELDETFTLAATVTAGTATDPTDATGTILNDDAAPTVTIANVSQTEGNAGTSTMTFTVTLSTTSFEDVTLSFNTSNGTATLADNDYQSATGTVTILAGTTTATIDVTIVGDLKYELDETFTLAATVTAGTATDPADATGTILNDDAAPTVTIANVSQAEGNAGTSTMTFTVTLSTTSFEDVTLSFNTSNGTATLADNDYQSATGTVTILAGTTTATIDVTIVGDLKYELDETFTLAATVTAGTATDPTDATGTIQNDDAAPTVTIANVSQAEGNAGTSTMTFTVTLSTTSFEDVTLSFNTSNGTATLADNDYQSATGTVTILAGTTTATIDVTIVGDLKYELDETFTLAATVTAGTATDPTDATGTILNDDAAPTVTIANVSQTEGNAGTSTMTFTVTLSTTSFEDITLSFNTSNGTATLADNDYQLATGTVTILAGTTTATVDVTIVGDLKYELDETFTLAATVTAGTATDPTDATGTILNDDAAPTVTIANVSQAEGNAGTSTMTFTVTLSTTSFEDVTLSFNTSNGTATLADNDYQSATGTVTILAGTTTATIDVTIVGDLKYELDETFTLAATVTAGTATDPTDATGTILNDDAAPTVTIANVSQTEGNAGTSTMTFTVTLSTTSFEDVTLSFNTSNGTATLADNDYQSATGTVTILAGTTTATIDVTIVGDLKYELDETFTLAATVTAGTATDPTDATGTILNDDAAPTVAIANVSQTEGNAGTSTMTFTVTLSTTSFEDVTLSFNTSNGTATLADNDYQSATGTVTILAGTTTATIDVTIVGDLKYELDETFTLAATVTAGTATDPADATGTIQNDDAAPTVTIANVSQTEGNAGTSTMTFTVTLSTTSFEDVTLSFNTSNGTATLADNDYQSATGTVTILAGTTTATVDVTIVGDLKYELDETFTLAATVTAGTATDPTDATGTILNDDAAPTVTIANVSQTEGNAGTSTMTFTVTLSTTSFEDVTLSFNTSNGTATLADNDYQSATGTVTILAGTTTATIDVTIVGDLKYELDETFTLAATVTAGTATDPADATGTILNDDAAPTVTIANVSQAEGNAGTSTMTFTVTLSTTSFEDVTLSFNTSNGTATLADNDYQSATGTVTILAGTTTATIDVTIVGDLKYELDETFTLAATVTAGTATDPADATGTIQNDDAAPTVTIADVSQAEGNAGTSTMTFTVTLSTTSFEDVTLSFNTSNGTATLADNDYQSATGTVTILAGTTTATVDVTIVGDLKYELDETFTLTATVTAGTTTNTTASATGTILNDDAIPSITINDVTVSENAGTATFTVILSNPSSLTTTVDFGTSDGTALNGTDYTGLTGTLTFAPGVTTQFITVPILNDNVHESTKFFNVNLSNPVNATITDNQGIATIVDNDPIPSITIADIVVDVNAGTATFIVSLSNPSDTPINADYIANDGTAVNGTDYTGISGTLTFNPGATTQTLTVPILNNAVFSPSRFFTVDLSNPANASIADSQGIGTITNSTPPPPFVIPPPAPPVQVVAPITYVPPTIEFRFSTTSLMLQRIELPTITLVEGFNKMPEIIVSEFTKKVSNNREIYGYFTVYLTVKPEDSVTIDLEGVNLPEGSLSQKSVTFTPDNWNKPIMVEVRKDLVGGDENTGREKVITRPAKSGDSDFDNIKPNDVNIHVPNDEHAANVGETGGANNGNTDTNIVADSEDLKTAMVILYENK